MNLPEELNPKNKVLAALSLSGPDAERILDRYQNMVDCFHMLDDIHKLEYTIALDEVMPKMKGDIESILGNGWDIDDPDMLSLVNKAAVIGDIISEMDALLGR